MLCLFICQASITRLALSTMSRTSSQVLTSSLFHHLPILRTLSRLDAHFYHTVLKVQPWFCKTTTVQCPRQSSNLASHKPFDAITHFVPFPLVAFQCSKFTCVKPILLSVWWMVSNTVSMSLVVILVVFFTDLCPIIGRQMYFLMVLAPKVFYRWFRSFAYQVQHHLTFVLGTKIQMECFLFCWWCVVLSLIDLHSANKLGEFPPSDVMRNIN